MKNIIRHFKSSIEYGFRQPKHIVVNRNIKSTIMIFQVSLTYATKRGRKTPPRQKLHMHISKCLTADGNLIFNSLEIGLSGKWSCRRRAHLLAPPECSLKPNQSMWKTNTRLKRTEVCAAVLLPSSPNWIRKRNMLVFWTTLRFLKI